MTCVIFYNLAKVCFEPQSTLCLLQTRTISSK